MKLSVIIPVYRTEQTLNRCVDSVVGQSFCDLEVILVDDGSPDRCPQLCDEWGQRDQRVRVVHQRNGGLSAARNTGIAMAKGEFVTFVDSDDYVDKDTYRQVMPLSEGADIVEFPFYRFYGSPQQTLVTFAAAEYYDMKQYWLEGRAYEHTYAWNKVYRRELFDDILFPVGKVFEDVFTLPRLLQKCRSVATTDKGLYYYCLNNHGITATATGLELQMLLDSHLAAISLWQDDRYYMQVLNIQMDVCRRTGVRPRLHFRRVNPAGVSLTLTSRAKALLLNLIRVSGMCSLNKLYSRK